MHHLITDLRARDRRGLSHVLHRCRSWREFECTPERLKFAACGQPFCRFRGSGKLEGRSCPSGHESRKLALCALPEKVGREVESSVDLNSGTVAAGRRVQERGEIGKFSRGHRTEVYRPLSIPSIDVLAACAPGSSSPAPCSDDRRLGRQVHAKRANDAETVGAVGHLILGPESGSLFSNYPMHSWTRTGQPICHSSHTELCEPPRDDEGSDPLHPCVEQTTPCCGEDSSMRAVADGTALARVSQSRTNRCWCGVASSLTHSVILADWRSLLQ
jgi:hypothetical protein